MASTHSDFFQGGVQLYLANYSVETWLSKQEEEAIVLVPG
jgi:hypothetical protein